KEAYLTVFLERMLRRVSFDNTLFEEREKALKRPISCNTENLSDKS
ncbi:MAG: hypothetical protein K0Q51_1558, partial [Rickettsiaceae bacterium]|nr:hypothetical protein [Rickettsiaceae bacterium]